MGRQIRRVPPNWEHPRDSEGHYVPLYDSTVAAYRAIHEEYYGCDPGDALDSDEYRDEYTEEPTWWQCYEDFTPGTPVTPPFETSGELREHLITHGEFGAGKPLSPESVDHLLDCGWVPTLAVTTDGRLVGWEDHSVLSTGAATFSVPDGSSGPPCGHIGVRSGRPCQAPTGHAGQHRY